MITTKAVSRFVWFLYITASLCIVFDGCKSGGEISGRDSSREDSSEDFPNNIWRIDGGSAEKSNEENLEGGSAPVKSTSDGTSRNLAV